MKFFETIRIQDGKVYHIDYHNRRATKTRREVFGIEEPFDLASSITPPPKGLFRCKIVYDTEIRSVTYHPYRPKEVHSFKLIAADIDYRYKYLDRFAIDALYAKRDGCDEILIVTDGLITDTSIHNVAFYYKGEWLTPAQPLLAGTTRARLLDEKKLREAQIAPKDLAKFATMAIMNAMIGFKILRSFTIKDAHAL